MSLRRVLVLRADFWRLGQRLDAKGESSASSLVFALTGALAGGCGCQLREPLHAAFDSLLHWLRDQPLAPFLEGQENQIQYALTVQSITGRRVPHRNPVRRTRTWSRWKSC